MLLKLVNIFGYLSVLLRAGTLVFQSLLLGGALFLLWIARGKDGSDAGALTRVRASGSRLLQFSAIALAVVQALYLYVNSGALVATAEIGWRDVIGANFFIAGCIIFAASLAIVIAARRSGWPRKCARRADAAGAGLLDCHQPCGIAAGGPSAADGAEHAARAGYRLLDWRPAIPAARPVPCRRQRARSGT